MLRITGGACKGRVFRSPARGGVRPSSDRVRAAVFNVLERWGVEDRRVLDLFAGTGSLGLEALSRGAASADFVERDPRQCAVIRENVRALGLDGRARVWRGEAARTLERLDGPFDLALMDPPYAEAVALATQALETLDRRGLLAPDAVVVVEHARRAPLPSRVGRLRATDERHYGDSAVSFFRLDEGAVQ